MRPALTRSSLGNRPGPGPKRASAKKTAVAVCPGLDAFYEDDDGALTGGQTRYRGRYQPVAGCSISAPYAQHELPGNDIDGSSDVNPYRPSSKITSSLPDRPHTSGAYIKYTWAGGA
jgi:hypothetical protein